MSTASGGSRHLTVRVERSAAEVYAYACDPAHLPEWAAGLATTLERHGDQWVVRMPDGEAVLEMGPPNELGVLDHWVTTPDGHRHYNPMRVLALDDGCEVVFSLRPTPGMTDAELERDAATVQADLERLRDRVQAPAG
ncbi:polyketide cyclase/dehydrase/lipid transport protein [Motilibacter peucedani]|uniref:Polyketide cyclase/dehydrase/lipid transport protein n=1 Tax=Motilibacter peucedani TaxID=598650 RepID=A0A420XSQ0_9ACTN|nr:SRPBCC family protein [Motilibacter peucedani]RKS77925.1 polyketide cyclase/dehydrase/lipid transport protein [Motilibacter peucedani]